MTAESGINAMDEAKVGQASHMDGVTLLVTGELCTLTEAALRLVLLSRGPHIPLGFRSL